MGSSQKWFCKAIIFLSIAFNLSVYTFGDGILENYEGLDEGCAFGRKGCDGSGRPVERALHLIGGWEINFGGGIGVGVGGGGAGGIGGGGGGGVDSGVR